MGTETTESFRAEGEMGNHGAMVFVAVENIGPNPSNPRRDFDKAGMEELAQSIRTHGIIEPIVVRWMGEDREPQVQIIAGERRWRAAIEAGLAEIPCRVMRNMSDEQALEWALIENLCRRDINAIEEAEGYAKLREMGYEVKRIAETVNRAPESVSNAMRLLGLPEPVLEQVRTGELSPSHGKALLTWADYPVMVEKLADEAKRGATSKSLEKPDWWTMSNSNVGAVKRGATFAACAECEHHRESMSTHFCLAVTRFEECKAADEARRAEENPGEVSLSRVQDLGGSWTQLYEELEGCEATCEHRRRAIGYGNREIEVCLKPACATRLKQEKYDRSKAERQAETDRRLARMRELIADPETKDALLRRILGCLMEHVFRYDEADLTECVAATGLGDLAEGWEVNAACLAKHRIETQLLAAGASLMESMTDENAMWVLLGETAGEAPESGDVVDEIREMLIEQVMQRDGCSREAAIEHIEELAELALKVGA